MSAISQLVVKFVFFPAAGPRSAPEGLCPGGRPSCPEGRSLFTVKDES